MIANIYKTHKLQYLYDASQCSQNFFFFKRSFCTTKHFCETSLQKIEKRIEEY